MRYILVVITLLNEKTSLRYLQAWMITLTGDDSGLLNRDQLQSDVLVQIDERAGPDQAHIGA